MITTRHNVDILTSVFHLRSEINRKQGNIKKWLILAKCICGRYKTHVRMAKLPPPPTTPPKWHKISYLANFILRTSITIPWLYSFHYIAVTCQNVEGHNSFPHLRCYFSSHKKPEISVSKNVFVALSPEKRRSKPEPHCLNVVWNFNINVISRPQMTLVDSRNFAV